MAREWKANMTSDSLTPLEKRILDLVFDAWAQGTNLDLAEVADSIMALVKEENEACALVVERTRYYDSASIAEEIRARMKE